MTSTGVVERKRVSAYPGVSPESKGAGGKYVEIPMDQAIADEHPDGARLVRTSGVVAKFLEVLGTKIQP